MKVLVKNFVPSDCEVFDEQAIAQRRLEVGIHLWSLQCKLLHCIQFIQECFPNLGSWQIHEEIW